MKFIIEYGCDICTEHLAVEADYIETAVTFAEAEAWRLRESYEGLHGVLDYGEFCDENNLDPEDDSSWEEFADMVRWELNYYAEVFDKDNGDHISILEDYGGEFFKI